MGAASPSYIKDLQQTARASVPSLVMFHEPYVYGLWLRTHQLRLRTPQSVGPYVLTPCGFCHHLCLLQKEN